MNDGSDVFATLIGFAISILLIVLLINHAGNVYEDATVRAATRVINANKGVEHGR